MSAEVTLEYAKARISQFFTEEWPSTDLKDIILDRMSQGHSNTIHVVSRSNESIREPSKLLMRHNGGNHIDVNKIPIKLTEVEEIIVAKEMSDCGVGPKLHGVFPGGRIEGFIKGSTITTEDYSNDERMKQLARTFAHFHSCQPPLERNMLDRILTMKWTMSDTEKNSIMAEFETESHELATMLQELIEWDVITEIKYILQMFREKNFRQSFMLFDPNSSNIISCHGTGKIMLIDYEMSMYGYSAIDLGGALLYRQLTTRDLNKPLTGLDYPSPEQIRSFVTAYVDESRQMGTLDHGHDVDRLVVETEFGALFMCLLLQCMVFVFSDDLPHHKGFVTLLHRFKNHYTSTKERLLRQLEELKSQ